MVVVTNSQLRQVEKEMMRQAQYALMSDIDAGAESIHSTPTQASSLTNVQLHSEEGTYQPKLYQHR